MRVLGTAVAATAAAALLAACGGGPGGGGGKISDDKIVLAVLNDQSGVYADLSGKSSVEAVRMAVADYKKKYGDKAVSDTIEVVSVDHQNKPDVANSKAQELYDRQKADVILDVPTSSAALAVANVAKAKKKIFMDVGAATTALEGEQCNKYTFHYGYNTYMLAHGTGAAVTEDGARNWYIVYPDYAFGQDMEKNFTTAVKAAGGTVVKSDPAPFPNDNFSTFLLKAPGLNPKPEVLGTMQAGGDLVNLVKQYNEYKLRDKGIGLAVGLMFITDIHSLGSVEATAGAAGPIRELAQAPTAYAEAHRVADALISLGRVGGGAGADELGYVGLLLGAERDVEGFLAATLGPVLTYDARRGTALIQTLEAYFAAGTSLSRTADELHIHVNTVTQRLERIARLLGPNWQHPAEALEIQLALRLNRLQGQ